MSLPGLDPALPLFITLSNNQKLDSGDAKFVDVLHTNAGQFGKLERSGTVDFYANGGLLQPGCVEISTDFSKYFLSTSIVVLSIPR